MPNRFLIPALITGMILTVRIITSFQRLFPFERSLAGCLQLPVVQVPGNGSVPHPEHVLMLPSA